MFPGSHKVLSDANPRVTLQVNKMPWEERVCDSSSGDHITPIQSPYRKWKLCFFVWSNPPLALFLLCREIFFFLNIPNRRPLSCAVSAYNTSAQDARVWQIQPKGRVLVSLWCLSPKVASLYNTTLTSKAQGTLLEKRQKDFKSLRTRKIAEWQSLLDRAGMLLLGTQYGCLHQACRDHTNWHPNMNGGNFHKASSSDAKLQAVNDCQLKENQVFVIIFSGRRPNSFFFLPF